MDSNNQIEISNECIEQPNEFVQVRRPRPIEEHPKKPRLRHIVPLHEAGKDDTLTLNLDLDSIFGLMSFETFKLTFKQCIALDLSPEANLAFNKMNCIKTNHSFGNDPQPADSIHKKPHVRLGTCVCTEFGSLDFYFVLLDSQIDKESLREEVFNHFFSNCSLLGNKAPSLGYAKGRRMDSASGSFRSIASAHDFKLAIEPLFTAHYNEFKPAIFFETFGNKRSTTTNSLDRINMISKINSAFDIGAEDSIHVDICLSSSFGDETVTLPNAKFFEKVGLVPNYKPLLSNTVLNFNKSAGPSRQLGIFTPCTKVNFYSGFKYEFEFDKSKSYHSSLTINRMLTDIYGHRIYCNADKFDKLYTSYDNMTNNIALGTSNGTCRYRTEVRCKMTDVDTILDLLQPHLIAENFSYYNSDEFFEAMDKNLKLFLKIIKRNDLQSKLCTDD